MTDCVQSVQKMSGWGTPDSRSLIGEKNDWLGISRLDWFKFHSRCYYVKSRCDGRRPAPSTCTNEIVLFALHNRPIPAC